MAGCLQTRSRRRRRRPWWWLVVAALLLLLLQASSCEATRGMQPFKGRPLERGVSNNFFGFLPRGPAPPSGPSRQHNAIGAEDQGNP
ncbi:protein IDA-LIKE 2 [Oryza sativa Japonica Group]|uniref:protein IDA-LIKE 2 n=1 Tax=Oryza sativa subsp. japonica TaxID=39947 RepID=UPI000E1B9D8F|nr:protein IDA-LIKE 2-like [Oryza sativa Japonica Group]KAF2945184.1 hypothetical protein DAI22_02g199100 [Oryza sativa Japonica Group]